jgi:peptidoglycan/xylan/chitin deacetylase (PgdA/CDA1 family)
LAAARARALLIAAAALVVAFGAAYGVYRLSRARCFALGAPVLCRVATNRPEVALSFDDGPTPLGLETILPLLEAHHAHATFFLIGQEMERHPRLAPRLLAAGHEIANHSYSHVRMIGRTSGFYDREIEQTQALLAAYGSRSRLFRPPNGKKLIGLPRAVRRHGLTLTLWDVEDPATSDPAAFARQVVAKARPGSIILLHAMYPANATARQALPAILDGLAAKGLFVVSISQLRADARGPG